MDFTNEDELHRLYEQLTDLTEAAELRELEAGS